MQKESCLQFENEGGKLSINLLFCNEILEKKFFSSVQWNYYYYQLSGFKHNISKYTSGIAQRRDVTGWEQIINDRKSV